MLTVFDGANGYPISNDDYYIRELANGLDEVVFHMSIRDPMYKHIVEEARIRDRDQNYYLIKQIDAGNKDAKIVAQIDIDAFKSAMFENYTNNSATVFNTVLSVLPAGWNCIDHSGVTIRRTIPTGDNARDYNVTAWKVLQDCCNTYKVRFRFDNVNKIVYIVNPATYTNLGAYATRDLNLKDLNFKGKSTDFVTRLYAEGADGLTFADINGGKNYVDNNTYSNKVVSAYWKDERYEDAESLLADAIEKLKALAVPSRSYDCDVLDLANTNPDMYGFEDFSLFNIITLIDDAQERRLDYQIVERWNYPYYPVQNKVVLSTETPKIQNQVVSLIDAVSSPTSTFQQMMQSAIANSTALITGNKGGYVILHDSDGDGEPDEILIMNTPDIATATKVWRWNSNGLGYSNNGYNGNFGLAMTIDGSIVADFITAGTLNGGIVRAGSLDVMALSPSAQNDLNAIHQYIPVDALSNIDRWEINASPVTLGTKTVDGVTYDCLVLDGTGISSYTPSYQTQIKSNYIGAPTLTIDFDYIFSEDVTIANQQQFYLFYKREDNGYYRTLSWDISGNYEKNKVYHFHEVHTLVVGASNDYIPRIGFRFIPNTIAYITNISVTGLESQFEHAMLSYSASGLSSVVQQGNVISSINQSAEQVTINASKIDLSGNLNLKGDFTAYSGTYSNVRAELNDGTLTIMRNDEVMATLGASTIPSTNFLQGAIYLWCVNSPTSRNYSYIDGESASLGDTIIGNLTVNYESHFGGTVYNSSGGVVFTSDRRKKKNIKDLAIEKAKSFIMSLKPREYKFKKGISTSNRKHHGFIAQEVNEAMYEDWGLYIDDKEKDFVGLRYDELIADMVTVIQDQEKRIEALERRLTNDKSNN